MNALYDAPTDEHGKHIFAGIPTKTRATLRIDQSVQVQFACDGSRFAIAVRDSFGSLDRETLMVVLRKCLQTGDQIDRKASGAGVGLYLMFNAATTLYFNVVPGVTTEVVCAFDLESSRAQLRQFGFFRARADEAGVTTSTPARNLRTVANARRATSSPANNVIVAALSVAIAAVVLVAIFVWHHVASNLQAPADAAAAPPPPPVATLELDSTPSGAAATIDGKPVGDTPITLTDLAPESEVAIELQRVGYRTATVHLRVPPLGEMRRSVQHLDPSDDFVRVHFTSDPPGAQVLHLGETAAADRTYTPADIVVAAGTPQSFMLTMPNHVPLVIPAFTPVRASQPLEKGGRLVDGATLHIEGTIDGRVSVSGAPHCTALALPADCVLAPGSYTVTVVGTKIARSVQMSSTDSTLELAR